MTLQEMTQILDQHISKLGFSHFGFVPITRPLSFEFYQAWIQEGLHGDMKYLEDHAPIKENPQLKWARAQSALAFAIPYFPHPEKTVTLPIKQARLSLYAQGYDYHYWFRERMNKICTLLKEHFPNEDFVAMTDSSPVLERDLARRAQLGWVGKNTCLIHPKQGSLFFIGEIYTSLAAESEWDSKHAPLPDFCGTCTRCIEVCPTGALVEPRKLDARKCISYLTIESRTLPPENLREKIGDWFFGCDLCQTVCPWNQKIFKNQLNTDATLTLGSNENQILIEDLSYILSASGKKLEKDFFGTPMARAGSFGLKRNALIIVGNKKMRSLTAEVQALLNHEKLGPLALWTLQEFTK